MSNPNGGPEGSLFKPGEDSRRNPGGRTPTKWLRELLDAAYDKSTPGITRRQKIGLHLIEIATSWEVRVIGRDSDGELLKVASGRDAVEAAKLLMSYDMGKPVNSVELTSPDGSMSPGVAANKTTAELRAAIAGALGITRKVIPETIAPTSDVRADVGPDGPAGPDDNKPE